MLAIENVLVSDELFDEMFACDLSACKGECCVEGDAGAPLEEQEIGILEDILPQIEPYMTAEGKKAVAEMGVFDIDCEGGFATTLANDQECAFACFNENGVALCAIEKAFDDKKISFRKPASCHLYPIRISMVGGVEALNYHRWAVCKTARENGKRLGIPVFRFLKTPLTNRYGEEWYNQLEQAYELYAQQQRNNK